MTEPKDRTSSAPTHETPVAAATDSLAQSDTGIADTAVASAESGTGPEAGKSASDSLVGKTLLERYKVTRKIGQGGMGAVYEATHTLIGKRVAIKVLLDKHAQSGSIVARLKLEAKLASSIGHENIIDITDFGETVDGKTFVVMEYLEGESLASLLHRTGPLEPERALRIGRQIASALGAAHKKGVIHRDVKPENVFLLSRKGRDFAKVVDFGISKSLRPEGESDNESADDSSSGLRLTQTGMVLGTPLYMSPEQARGDEDLDHRIDVYALGVILYEMVTGEVPFSGQNYLSIISQVIADDPKPPGDLRPEIGAELEAVILRALDKDRDRRYASIEELDGDLAALFPDDGSTTDAGGRISAVRWIRRRRGSRALRVLGWAAGIAVLVSAIVLTVTLSMGGNDKARAMVIDAAPAQPVVATVPIDAVPASRTVKLNIVTEPEGAVVFRGDVRLCKPTPCTVTLVKRDRVIVLSARHEGYQEARIELNPVLKEDGSTIPVVLEKVQPKPENQRRRNQRRRRQRHRDRPDGDNAKVDRRDPAGGELMDTPYKQP